MHDVSFQATVLQIKLAVSCSQISWNSYDPTLEEIVSADQGHFGVVYSADMTLRRTKKKSQAMLLGQFKFKMY
jgi:hypothetical protein